MPRLIAGGLALFTLHICEKSDAATRARGAQPDAHQGLLAKLMAVETISGECPRLKKLNSTDQHRDTLIGLAMSCHDLPFYFRGRNYGLQYGIELKKKT